jgi:photosystem II stability/assembly factor-like uncharacterized protein
MKFQLLIVLFLVSILPVYSQHTFNVEVITSGTNTSLRGMSIPAENIIWVSGSNGIVGKSVDAGKTWRWIVVPGFEKRDFRDIEAFDSTTAIVMAIDNPANILKTTDGGATWKKVFEKAMDGMFLDAMDFKNSREGICIGDPLDVNNGGKKFYVIRTINGGDTWTEAAASEMQLAATGEAIFSASGTNITFLNHRDYEYAFITGGLVSNLYLIGKAGKNSKKSTIPIVSGKESTGAFSFATDRKNLFYTIGGDYKLPKNSVDNFYYTKDAGTTWKTSSPGSPSGYRSCIRIIEKNTLVACGTSGVDYAVNAEKDWKNISPESFNVCMVAKGKQVFFAGEKGKIGKLTAVGK